MKNNIHNSSKPYLSLKNSKAINSSNLEQCCTKTLETFTLKVVSLLLHVSFTSLLLHVSVTLRQNIFLFPLSLWTNIVENLLLYKNQSCCQLIAVKLSIVGEIWWLGVPWQHFPEAEACPLMHCEWGKVTLDFK